MEIIKEAIKIGEINNMHDGNMIISDTTIRTLLVKGIDEVERIKSINNNENILEVSQKSLDLYEIKIIYRVGDFSLRRR